MDLNQINQNVLNLIKNATNTFSFLKDFTVGSAKNVSMTYVNADGSESVKTFPNIAKMVATYNITNDNGVIKDMSGVELYVHTKKTSKYIFKADTVVDIDIRSIIGNGIIGFRWDDIEYPQLWADGLLGLDMGASPECKGLLIANLPVSEMKSDFSNSAHLKVFTDTSTEPTLDNCSDNRLTFCVWEKKLRVVNRKAEPISLIFYKVGY